MNLLNSSTKKSLMKHIPALFVALTATVFGLFSCSQADDWADDSLIARNEVTLTFALDLNSQVQSRAAGNRQLTSSDDWQKVSSVRIYVFRSTSETGTYTYYRPTDDGVPLDYIYISDFSGKTDVWGDDEPNWEEHEYVSGTLKFADGWYKFVAVGRDDIDGDDETGATWNLATLTEGTTTFENWTAATHNAGISCGEMFVGCTSAVEINDTQRLHETIILTRTVAGVLMYVENIASEINSTAVRSIGIVRRKHTWGLNLTTSLPTGSESSFAADGATLVGTTPAAEDFVVKYDIPTTQAVSNGYYVNLGAGGTDAHPNAVLRGSFVTPQAAPAADCTMNFVYLDASGNVLKSMDVKLADDIATKTPLYPLVANHIYCIGRRNLENNTDEPIDLGELPDNYIMVVGSWQVDVDIEM